MGRGPHPAAATTGAARAAGGRSSDWCSALARPERFILLKLLTGEFRVGVSQTLVVRALAQAAGLQATTIAARLMGEWTPSAEWYESLLSPGGTDDDRSRPYPFCLAAPLDDATAEARVDPARLADRMEMGRHPRAAGPARTAGAPVVAGRGAHHRSLPRIADAAAALPDGTVLDGEVLAFRDDRPLPFSALQQRIGRQKQVAQMARAVPVVFMTYDILEHDGRDIRSNRCRFAAHSWRSSLPRGGGFGAVSLGRVTRAQASSREPLLPFEQADEDASGPAPAPPSVLRISRTVQAPSWTISPASGARRALSASRG